MFLNRQCKAWSVWVGNQFLFSCTGTNVADAANELETLLNSLDKNGKGIYTLKVYEDIKKQKITNKTECHGSFNFRLQAFNADTEGSLYYKEMREELKTLKAERDQLQQELEELPEEDERPRDFLGRIGEVIMEDPTKLPLLLQTFQQALQPILAMFTTQTKVTGQQITPAPAMISGVGPDPLQQAIETLKEKDPELTRHLQKLAQIATNDKPTFDYLLTLLDSIK